MSIWHKAWAYEQHPLQVDKEGNPKQGTKNPPAKAVLVALAEFPQPGVLICWPAQETLAEMTDYDERTVRRHMAALERQGYIKRTERWSKDHRRLSDQVKFLGPAERFGPGVKLPDTVTGSDDELPDRVSRATGQSVRGTVNKNRNGKETSSLPAESESGDSSPPEDEAEKVKTMEPGAYGVKLLMDKVAEARARGWDLYDPPNRGNYGQFYKNRLPQFDDETLELALDYLVAKAADQVEGEKKAWCGFDTALDAVRAGWRPSGKQTREDKEKGDELRRQAEERRQRQAKMIEEALKEGA
jgi:hypothetical protein